MRAPTCFLVQRGAQKAWIYGLFPESQGQNLALTVLYVPRVRSTGDRVVSQA